MLGAYVKIAAFFTFISVCIVNYDIRILSALKCGQNADIKVKNAKIATGNVFL